MAVLAALAVLADGRKSTSERLAAGNQVRCAGSSITVNDEILAETGACPG
jgi:hypothetical protein